MSNVLSISTLTPKVSAWPSTFHTGRMNAAGEKGTFIFYCEYVLMSFGSIALHKLLFETTKIEFLLEFSIRTMQ